jgi:hypothetical protein
MRATFDRDNENDSPARRRFRRRDALALAGLAAFAALLLAPVFARGFPAAFDAVRHYRWTSQFIDALGDGALFPRWLPTANNAQGSPAVLYYPPPT